MAAQTMPLTALVTNFGQRLHAGMLQADGGATTLSAALATKFGSGISAGMLLANGSPDNTLGGPGYQDWRQAP